MIEFLFVCSLMTMIGSIANIVNALWEHDTKNLLPWLCCFAGWFVAFCQISKQILKVKND